MFGFLAGLSSPESIFAEKILISCFVTKTGNMLFFPKNRKYVIFSQNRINSHQLLLHRQGEPNVQLSGWFQFSGIHFC